MAQPYQQLVNDHQHLRTLLRFLRKEIQAYDDTLVETDTALVMEALEYLKDYPQLYHHPLEEAAMDCLLERGQGDPAALATIRAQHRELEQKTSELETLFEMIYADHVVPVQRIKEQLNQYLDLQFQHLETEDQYLFPILAAQLSTADWDNIGRLIAGRPDPLFRKQQVETYSELSRHLALS